MEPKPFLPLFTLTLLVLFVTLLFSSPSKVTAREAGVIGKNSSPVAFLENLKGSHKGDKVKEINDLKKYLTQYGYLDCKNHIHSDDEFDEHLEEAVRVYQINFNLDPTGILDEETVAMMMRPRCGVADIINGTTSMRIATMKLNYSEVPIRVRYVVNPAGKKWSKYKITFAMLPKTPPVCRVPIPASYKIIERHTPFRFKETQNHQTADMKIDGHGRLENNVVVQFDGPGGALAHASMPTEGIFHFDTDDKWTPDGPNSKDPAENDCMGIALHEIGHLLGLDHSSVKTAVMAPFSCNCRDLTQDDVQGLKALYKF